jgi:hypothetical protein
MAKNNSQERLRGMNEAYLIEGSQQYRFKWAEP